MRDKFYGDNRDLVKWGTLIEVAHRYDCKHILQVLYFRPSQLAQIEIDGKQVEIAEEIFKHFRDSSSIRSLEFENLRIDVFSEEFVNRPRYLDATCLAIRSRKFVPGVVFLDPDTGLEPESGNYDSKHVREVEVREIWKFLRPGDVLVLYQHQDNRSGKEWIERKRTQFAQALEIIDPLAKRVKLAYAPDIAQDVAFYFVRKD